MFDTAIIGTGPAGISAALTLQALKKNIILFGSGQLSQKIRAAEQIRNYPGLPMVTGAGMQAAFAQQLEGMEIPITEKTVTGTQLKNGYKVTNLQTGDLVFFENTYNTSAAASHVGIYIGNNQFIHAANGGVKITSLDHEYYAARYIGARRVAD